MGPRLLLARCAAILRNLVRHFAGLGERIGVDHRGKRARFASHFGKLLVAIVGAFERPRAPALLQQPQSGDVLQVDTGSLYPALHRLERQKWIKSAWKLTENNQRAKFYQLTAAGRRQLAEERSRWTQMSDAIAAVLKPVRSE